MELLDCVHNASASVASSCGDFDDASVVCQGMYTVNNYCGGGRRRNLNYKAHSWHTVFSYVFSH